MRQIAMCVVSVVFASAMFGCGSKDSATVADNSAGAVSPAGEGAAPGGAPVGMSGMGGMAGMGPMGPPGGEGAAGGPSGGPPGTEGAAEGTDDGSASSNPAPAGVAGEGGGFVGLSTGPGPGGVPSGPPAGVGGYPMPGGGYGGRTGPGGEGAGAGADGGLPNLSTPGGIPGAAGFPGGAGYPSGRPGPGSEGAGAGSDGGLPGLGGGLPGGPGSPGGDGAAQAPTTYDGFAKQAFEQGRENEAMRYLLAWALTSDAGAADVLSSYQWVPALKRPTAAVRWGVGIHLTIPKGFDGDVKPIGSQQTLGGARGGNPGPSGIGGFDPGSGGAGGGGELERLAGEFGTKLLAQFHERVSAGKFGKALKDAPGPVTDANAAGAAGGFAGGGNVGVVGLGLGGGADGAGRAGADGAGRSGSDGPGNLGAGRRGMRGGPGGKPGGLDFGGAGAGGGVSVSNGQLAPGLALLGLGTDKELKERAAKEGIDVLALFKVKVSVNRAGIIINDTEADLLLVKGTLKEPIGSALLNNIKVQKDREAAKSDGKEDLVDKEVKRMFDKVDANFVMTSMPSALTPEIVKTKRVEGQLLTGVIDDPLSVLAEIRFYHRNKLLNDADTAAAFVKVAGAADGKILLEGKEEDRKKVVEKWLPKS